ncbi:60S ribosomal protein L8-3-like [Papaver somniferum]|uniref:60S ribosomal protein L8-3-like n=1 Tax=Papaver somniferum TaxID=3469 RepID=UPI000E6F7FCB|nr:60S ribosomal protein L8-3-like [Papaver somniferum]
MSGNSESSNPSTPPPTTTFADVHSSENQPLLDCENNNTMVAQVAGGGSTEKAALEAGNASHKCRIKRNRGPRIHGVANGSKKRKRKKVCRHICGDHFSSVRRIGINAFKYPHGPWSIGGDRVTVSSASRDAPPGKKLGLIASRRTGRLRGQVAAVDEA